MSFFYKHFEYSIYYFGWFGYTKPTSPPISKHFMMRFGLAFVYLLGISLSLLCAIPYYTVIAGLDSWMQMYNLALTGYPHQQFQRFWSIHSWQKGFALPGYILGFLFGGASFIAVLTMRFIYENLRTFTDSFKFGISSPLTSADLFLAQWRKKDLLSRILSMMSLILGFSLGQLARAMIWHTIYSLKNIAQFVRAAYSVAYWDHQSFSKPDVNLKGGLGVLLGIGSFIAVSVVVISTRIISQTFLTMVNNIVRAFRDGRLWVKKINDLPLESVYEFKQTNFEIILGALGKLFYWPFLGFWSMYGLIVDLILYYSMVNTLDMIEFFINLCLEDVKLSREKPFSTTPIVGKKNYFGIFGYIIGVYLGVLTAIFIASIRFLFELFPAVYKGLKGGALWQDQTLTLFKKLLTSIPFAIGIILRHMFLMLYVSMGLVINGVFFDHHPKKMTNFTLTTLELFSGALGGIVIIPILFVVGLGACVYRLIYESYLSFCDLLQWNSSILSESRHDMAKYGFGGLGLGLAAMAIGFGYIGQLLILPLLKWWNMYQHPRFSHSCTQDNSDLQKIKNLYGALNNLSRTFVLEPDAILENHSGGKGTYCFIGKVLELNTPSVAEEYMDALLAQYHQHDRLTLEDLEDLRNEMATRVRLKDENPETLQELVYTHEYVKRYMFGIK